MKEVIFFDYQSKFSTKLRDLIEEKGITKQKLSEEIGVSRQAISQYCDGSTVPNADKFLKIAEFFDVSLDYLVGKTESKTPVDSVEGELVRAICDYTGLNENAVFNLAFRNKNAKEFEDETAFDFLNYLLDYDKQGIFLVTKVAEIKCFLIKYTKALENNREKNIELFKSKIAEDDSNAEQLKEFLEVTEFNAKMTMEKDVGYGKYEAEKLFGYLLDEYIKDAEQEFKKEIDIRWQL